MIKSIDIKGLLSFGPQSPKVELGNLNVLVGPNGSGKSNFLDVLRLLQHCATDVSLPIRQSGGHTEWAWKKKSTNGEITIELGHDLVHRVKLAWSAQAAPFVAIEDEFIRSTQDGLQTQHTRADAVKQLAMKQKNAGYDLGIDPPTMSMINWAHHPAGDYLMAAYRKISIYSDWAFGRRSKMRRPQAADEPNDRVSETFTNVSMVLARLLAEAETRQSIKAALALLLPGFEEIMVVPYSNTVQLLIQEHGTTYPASRLSDGTLQFLTLLCILCNRSQPCIICLEEPDLGLHPDLVRTLADLVIEASSFHQIILTTHSATLMDAFTDQPECLLVCENHEAQTTIERPSPERLQAWLQDFSLGELWRAGELGGNPR